MASSPESALSSLEYHVLLALAGGPLHGYAVRDAVEEESGGAVAPGAGTLYRVIARLLRDGRVEEVDDVGDEGPHPGRPRRTYGLTTDGRAALLDEARRLKHAAALAEDRLSRGRP